MKCNREPEREKKEQWRQEYQQKSRIVKKKTRRDKRRFVDDLACEAEVAAGQRNMNQDLRESGSSRIVGTRIVGLQTQSSNRTSDHRHYTWPQIRFQTRLQSRLCSNLED